MFDGGHKEILNVQINPKEGLKEDIIKKRWVSQLLWLKMIGIGSIGNDHTKGWFEISWSLKI